MIKIRNEDQWQWRAVYELARRIQFLGVTDVQSRSPGQGIIGPTQSENLKTRKGHFSINMCAIHLKI
jgi:hypothetical protein